jgi:hypothetical protein
MVQGELGARLGGAVSGTFEVVRGRYLEWRRGNLIGDLGQFDNLSVDNLTRQIRDFNPRTEKYRCKP